MDETPEPGLAPAFTLTLRPLAACRVGALATGGVREHLAFAEGRLHGERLSGVLLADHSGETRLLRTDGVVVIEAVYLVRAADGAVLRLLGTGYEVAGADFTGVRMSLAVEADEAGPHAWLSTRVFVAERPADSDRLEVALVV